LIEAVKTWLKVVEAETSRKAVIYTRTNFWTQNMLVDGEPPPWTGEHPLWIAHYGVNLPRMPLGWQTWTFWQYSEKESVRGVKGSVDLNWFQGSEAELREFSNRGALKEAAIDIPIRSLADNPSEIDLLQFGDYAEALVDFIQSAHTATPLTIGIDAPWGMGKTTLMLMVERLLVGEPADSLEASPSKNAGPGGRQGNGFYTVWFNAWQHDQEEELWAAITVEILAQIRRAKSLKERTVFALRLGMKRFAWDSLLQSILRSVGAVLGIGLLGGAIFGIAFAIFGDANQTWEAIGKYVTAVGGLGVLSAVYAVGREGYDVLSGTFDLKISKHMRKPDYQARIGFLAEVKRDFGFVSEIIEQEGRKLVVFIDDLDRCSPPKPADIVEALNLILGAKECVFILGMDSPTVAGSIEAKYKDLKEYLLNPDDPGGLTLGQRFLEKIVQISFSIPKTNPEVIAQFVNANLDVSSVAGTERASQEALQSAERQMRRQVTQGKSIQEAEAEIAASQILPEEAIRQARRKLVAETIDETDEFKEAVNEASEYLNYNPRKIKRYVNLLRLKSLVANRRGLLESRTIDMQTLGRLVTIEMQWPEMLEGLSRADEEFVNRLREAHDLQEEIRDFKADTPDEEELLKQKQERLERLTRETRITQLVKADSLFDLLDLIEGTLEGMDTYLQLAAITGGSEVLA
jgi:hypothetical protein